MSLRRKPSGSCSKSITRLCSLFEWKLISLFLIVFNFKFLIRQSNVLSRALKNMPSDLRTSRFGQDFLSWICQRSTSYFSIFWKWIRKLDNSNELEYFFHSYLVGKVNCHFLLNEYLKRFFFLLFSFFYSTIKNLWGSHLTQQKANKFLTSFEALFWKKKQIKAFLKTKPLFRIWKKKRAKCLFLCLLLYINIKIALATTTKTTNKTPTKSNQPFFLCSAIYCF